MMNCAPRQREVIVMRILLTFRAAAFLLPQPGWDEQTITPMQRPERVDNSRVPACTVIEQ